MQKASLSSKIADLEKALKAAKQDASKATASATSAAKKAESEAKSCAGDLASAKAAAKAAASEGKDAAACQAKLSASEEALTGKDVQAVLALRRNTIEGIATVKEYSGKAYEEATKAAGTAGESLEVTARVLSAKPATKAVLHYKPLGAEQAAWTTVPMPNRGWQVFTAGVPATTVRPPLGEPSMRPAARLSKEMSRTNGLMTTSCPSSRCRRTSNTSCRRSLPSGMGRLCGHRAPGSVAARRRSS